MNNAGGVYCLDIMVDCTRRSFLATSAAAAAAPSFGATEHLKPSAGWSPERISTALLQPGSWKPFPTASDRAGWGGVPVDLQNKLVAAAEPLREPGWPVLPAHLALGFARTGNRSEYEGVRNQRRERLRTLAVAECVESKGRFLDAILDGLWATCEETFWGVPAHLTMQKAGIGLPEVTEPVVDLFAAETAAELAWIDYLLAPQLETLSPLLRERIHLEIERRVLVVNRARNDFWWMGFRDPSRPPNNWNPWINSNWLTCELLVEQDRAKRAAGVYKILTSLDNFLAGYSPDGGCDEGPSYWSRAGASLFDCLDLLHSASAGRVDYFGQPLIHQIGRYICRVHIHDDWFVNFADASAKLNIPADLVYRYGRAVKDRDMQLLGAFAAADAGAALGGSIGRQLAAIFNWRTLSEAPKGQALLGDSWLPGIQVMAARRRAGSAEGLYLAAKGGNNGESHNHNDVGNFIVFADGKPVIIDIGVETYSRKTFSPERYEIWTMQSAWHNLPTVDGVMQAPGKEFAAGKVSYQSDGHAAGMQLNIERAYPPEAGIESWRRELRLDRDRNQIEITDRYRLKRSPGKLTLTLMTPVAPRLGGPGEIVLDGVGVHFDGRSLKPVVEEAAVADARLQSTWGTRLYRILLTAERPAPEGVFTVRLTQA